MPTYPVTSRLSQIADSPRVLGAWAQLYPATNWASLHTELGGTPDQYFGCYVTHLLADGQLLAGFGNRPADHSNAYLAILSKHAPPTIIATLPEEGVHDIATAPNGNITILGVDPHADWSLGNVYIYDPDNRSLTQHRTLPYVIHSLSQFHHPTSGYWYVGTGAHTGDNSTWTGRVYKSNDLGQSWTQLPTQVCDYRVYNLAWYRNMIYAAGMSQNQYNSGRATIYTSNNDGASWTSTNIEIRARSRWQLVPWLGLIAVGIQPNQLTRVKSNGDIDTITTPFAISSNIYAAHLLAQSSSPNRLYVCSDTAIWSYDGSQWVEEFPTAGWPLITPTVWDDWLLAARTHQTDPALLAWPRHGLRPATITAHQNIVDHLNTTYLRRTPPLALVPEAGTRGTDAIDLQYYTTDRTQVASGDYATVVGGRENTASGYAATVVGGQGNIASGPGSIAMGTYCIAYGEGSIALGFQANAWDDQLIATAGIAFSEPGDAQTIQAWSAYNAPSLALNTWYNLIPEIDLPHNGIYLTKVTLTGVSTNAAQAWAYEITAAVLRNGSNYTILTQTTTNIYRADTAYEAQLAIVNGNQLTTRIRRTGGTSYTSRWHAHTTINFLKAA